MQKIKRIYLLLKQINPPQIQNQNVQKLYKNQQHLLGPGPNKLPPNLTQGVQEFVKQEFRRNFQEICCF